MALICRRRGATVLIAMAIWIGPFDAWSQMISVDRPTPTSLDTAAADFKADPSSLLKAYGSAGLPMTIHVRGLLLSDPSLIDALLQTASRANSAQQAAIGAGLAEATQVIVEDNPKLAAGIQQKVALSGLLELISAFATNSGGTNTASIGGGGSAGGGGSGPTGGVTNGGGGGGARSTNLAASTLPTANGFAGFSVAGSASINSGGYRTYIANSVSPTQ